MFSGRVKCGGYTCNSSPLGSREQANKKKKKLKAKRGGIVVQVVEYLLNKGKA
jgi:hypothetical protein